MKISSYIGYQSCSVPTLATTLFNVVNHIRLNLENALEQWTSLDYYIISYLAAVGTYSAGGILQHLPIETVLSESVGCQGPRNRAASGPLTLIFENHVYEMGLN